MKRAIVALAVAAVMLTGCTSTKNPVPIETQKGYEISPNDMTTFETTLPSGKKIECVVVTYRGSAIQCWEVPS